VVTGCTGSSEPQATPAPSESVSSAASPTGTPSLPPTPSATASPTTASPSAGSAAAAPTCRTSALHLIARNGGAAAGTSYQLLVVENIGDAPCTLFGYPGASFLGTDGQPLGSPARRDPSVKSHHIRLAPGDKANARLGAPNPDFFSESDCHSEQATAVRVYPPDQTSPLRASVDQRVCTTKKGRATVTAFEAGPPGG
jgi:hypothetical protein